MSQQGPPALPQWWQLVWQDNNDYGVMGQVAVMDSSLVAGSEHIEMHIEPIDRKNHPHKYFNQVRLLGDGIYGEIILQDGTIYPSLCNNQTLFYLPDSTTQCTDEKNFKTQQNKQN